MAKQGQVWESATGKFGISHTQDIEPTNYPFDTQAEALQERDRIYSKAVQVERTCAGGGITATAPHLGDGQS